MPQPALPPPGFDELSPDEKVEYIQALWDHVAEHPDDVPVPEWQRQVVAERLAAYRRGELTARPWSEVREELLVRLRTVRQMWRLDVSAEAELEIFEAALRYERERAGLGFGFEAQVNAVFVRLVESPLQFPVIEHDARRALVRDFPYGVFFTTEGDLITVLTVLHLRRHPDTWKRRRRDTE